MYRGCISSRRKRELYHIHKGSSINIAHCKPMRFGYRDKSLYGNGPYSYEALCAKKNASYPLRNTSVCVGHVPQLFAQ